MGLNKNRMLVIMLTIMVSFIFELNAENKILRTSNFCMLTPESRRVKNQCNDQVYNISCGNNMCTNNKTECDAFLITEYFHSQFEMSRYIVMLPLRAIESLKNQTVRFKNFKNKIKNCSPKLYSGWQSGEFCSKRKKCYISQDKRRNKKYTKSNCPCDGLHSYECKSDYCSTSEEACRAFSNQMISSIKTCPFLILM
jgi:hypothetical protein